MRPPAAGDTTADVAIVGAGVAGLALALALAEAGARPVVVDGRRVAAGASGRNAGFVLAGVAENYVAATRRYGAEKARRVWDLTLRNRELLRTTIARQAIDCELRWNGSLQVAGDEAEWAEVQASAAALAATGVRVRLDPAGRAAVYEEDGEIHPVRLCHGLAEAASRHGARIHEATQALAVSADAVVTPVGTIRAGRVVLCTNAHTARLLPGSRVVPIRGQILATAPVGRRVFDRPAYAHRGYRYWRQTADGRVLVGGWRDLSFGEETGEVERTTPTIQSALEGFLAEQGIGAPVTHRWAGIMGFSHDALPYVGRAATGVWVNGGFTGHGNAFVFATAEILADLLAGRAHADADLFDPERP